MKIGIQPTPIGFTRDWIDYCKNNAISYKLVDCYKNNIIEQLKDCDIFLWDHDLLLKKDTIVATRLLMALQHTGKIVFPSFYEEWHYDDKLAQKYLLESLDLPFVKTYLFVNMDDALEWASKTTYPKVFKLKGGAASSNVRLIKNKSNANKLIKKMFKHGIHSMPKRYFLDESYRKFKSKKISVYQFTKSVAKYFLPINKEFIDHKEKNYAYFQEFIPNNNSDIRIVVINENKAVGIRRLNRENDFRASGSGSFIYLDNDNIPKDCLKVAFEATKKLKMRSVGYDFVFNKNNSPLIIEITYSFSASVMNKCQGYWDDNLNWHQSEVNIQKWIIEGILNK